VVEEAERLKLDVRSERDARLLFERAIRDRLVRVEVHNDLRSATRNSEDEGLSRQLTDVVHTARQSTARWFEARVVDTDYSIGSSPEESDDSIHQQLGWHAGGVWLASELAPGDRLVISAGRAAVSTMDGLVKERGLADLSLYALSGASERGLGAIQGSSPDADSVVRHAVAACHYGGLLPARVRYTTLPLGLEPGMLDRDSQNGLLRSIAGHLQDEWFVSRRPEVAVLGLGCVTDRGHQLFLTENKFVRDHMNELGSLLDMHGPNGLEIGEIAHHMWVACNPEVPGYSSAAKVVDKLNRTLVAPTLTGLAYSRKRVLVGGGLRKVSILQSALLLKEFENRPTVLFTDTRAAQALLKLDWLR